MTGEDRERAMEIYNEVADRCGWPLARRLTDARAKRLKARLNDCAGIDGWRQALDRASRSSFLCGRTRSIGHEGWRPDLDFFLQESSFIRLLEGRYDDSTRPAPVDPILAALEAEQERLSHGKH